MEDHQELELLYSIWYMGTDKNCIDEQLKLTDGKRTNGQCVGCLLEQILNMDR